MKKILSLSIITALLAVFGLAFAGPTTATVSAAGKADVCAGLDAATGGTSGTCAAPAGSKTVEGTLATLVKVLSWVVGIISVIMVIVGGIQYVTSGGDSGKVTSAKNTIMYSLIGVVIVALAQTIVFFVLNKVS